MVFLVPVVYFVFKFKLIQDKWGQKSPRRREGGLLRLVSRQPRPQAHGSLPQQAPLPVNEDLTLSA